MQKNVLANYCQVDLMKLRALTNEEAICLLRRSEEHAFRYVFHMYGSQLYHHAHRFLKDDVLSEEVVQETMMALWEHRASLDEQQPLGGYLYTIAKRLTLNVLRKQANSNAATEQMWMNIQKNRNETEEKVLYADMKQQLETELQKMPAQQQLVFRLSRFDGFSHEEIADKLQVSKNTVKNHLVVALKRLRTQLHHLNNLYILLLGILM